MVEQSRSAGVGERFGTYIEELREFFKSRSVHFGSPADVVPFAERVNTPGAFQDEMGSMVRSIVYQEGDALGRGELLALVAVAVGGPEVETAAHEMHASVRQIFVFVNEALRQHRAIPGELAETEEVPVTAGHILAATTARGAAEGQAVAGRTPGNGFYAGDSAAPDTERGMRRSEPAGGGMLFKAVTMSESEKDRGLGEHEEEPRGVRPWLVPAVVAVAAVLGVGAYLVTSGTRHSAGTAATAGNVVAPLGNGAAASACVAGMAPGTRRATVEERSRWAHNLLDQKLYEAALPELRDVARIDPGYPGINLDQSQALLQMKRPEDAREAIDNQINISDCLSRLPAPALDAYCSSEFSPSTVSGCRPQLAHIRQAAELQAALVHLELGHRVAPDGASTDGAMADGNRETGAFAGKASAEQPRAVASAAATAPRSHRAAPLPPASEGDAGLGVEPRPATTGKAGASRPASKSNGDDSLRRGEGTDSVFGAYSKPQ